MPVPEASTAPKRTYEEALLCASRLVSAKPETRNKALWILNEMQLQPFALVDSNNVKLAAITHKDNLMQMIKPDCDNQMQIEHHHLIKHSYAEMSPEIANMLNTDWTVLSFNP
ncbi:hypothetical protein BDB00DRAFT_866903 [Zychaea mexicana]|uniref:uncharacterized protein n=1 Tax=Zychaea mexicana TaxID=64656 RepID=UPI0022FF367A|nr:uncharacterized protein BDB00DRAFT_866903 [Zychaea mexicana]KAI9498826.1 hypothetical protein BDB00DRAFT_866903 [Zychaea mexicana]